MVENRIIGRRYDGGRSPLGMGPPKLLAGTLSMALLSGADSDSIMLPGVVWTIKLGELRLAIPGILGISVEAFTRIQGPRQDELTRKLRRVVERRMRQQHPGLIEKFESDHAWKLSSAQRERVHREILRPWSAGPLRLEHPQGSSLHHLLRYDEENTPGGFQKIIISKNDTQCLVVENDWARVVPSGIVGEWRLPFEHCCWEMRISGVRVLTFTDAEDDENPSMFSVYGADGHWVASDHRYYLARDGLRAEAMFSSGVNVEFRRVSQMVRDAVRAACIMLDAGVCERVGATTVVARQSTIEGRVTVSNHAPRYHEVVRLLREDRRIHLARRVSETSRGESAPQRGHWRRGTWVHYDDPDSGAEQYADSGGFWHSRTWRRWHFAGDPRNIIEREYRL